MKENFNIWAETGEDVSLFRDLSDLVMTALFYIFLGPEFAGKHAEELVPMIRAYEWALQRPQTKVLPRWMSEEGRLLDSVEERFVGLVDDEINKRLKEKKRYEHNRDYLQLLLNMCGDKYLPGVCDLNYANSSLFITHPFLIERWPYKFCHHVLLVAFTCVTDVFPFNFTRNQKSTPS